MRIGRGGRSRLRSGWGYGSCCIGGKGVFYKAVEKYMKLPALL